MSKNRRARFLAILSQCAGAPVMSFFDSGLLVVVFALMGFGFWEIPVLIALPKFLSAALRIPFSFVADRCGAKLVGGVGTALTVAGFIFVFLSLFIGKYFLWFGIICYGIGTAGHACSWFAILHQIVRPDNRGKFLGRLRVCWQIFSIIIAGLLTYLLTQYGESTYSVFLFALVVFLLIRLLLYLQIPYFHTRNNNGDSEKYRFQFKGWLLYIGGTCFVFGMYPVFLALFSKTSIGLSDSTIVGNSIFYMIGSLVGLEVGGRVVDWLGSRHSMIYCSVLFIAIFCISVLSGGNYFFALLLCFGFVFALWGIAVSTWGMDISVAGHRALSTSIVSTVFAGTWALSNILSPFVIKMVA